MFEGMLKHTGMLNNTGKNVAIVFMSLPQDPEYALVIDTDALPDMYNDALRKILESVDAQQANNLAEVLGRRPSPDGSTQTFLERLHHGQRLHKVSIDNVTMTPKRGTAWPLREVLKAMKVNQPDLPAGFDDLDPETKAQVAAEIGKFNVHATNIDKMSAESKKSEAANLIEMARMLEKDAQQKRQQAYKLDPSLIKKTQDTTTGQTNTDSLASEPKTKLVRRRIAK